MVKQRGKLSSSKQRSRKGKRSGNKDLIEGRRAVAEALSLGLPLKQAYVAESTSRERDKNLAEIIGLLKRLMCRLSLCRANVWMGFLAMGLIRDSCACTALSLCGAFGNN